MATVPFKVSTKYGEYSDSLSFTPEEYAVLSAEDIERMKQSRVTNWIRHMERGAGESSLEFIQSYVGKFFKALQFVHSKVTDPVIGLSSIETFDSDTLYCLECPDFVFVSDGADIAQVKADYCKEQGIPIVRNTNMGGVFLYEGGKNLLICFVTKLEFKEDVFRGILAEVLKALGVPDVTLQSNDILSGNKQVGMTAPPVRLSNGRSYTGGQLTFDVDFDKVERCLNFTKEKWEDKGGAESVRDWIQPLSGAGNISIADFIFRLRDFMEIKLEVKLVEGR